MASILNQLDQLVTTAINTNIYTDTNTYLNTVGVARNNNIASQVQQVRQNVAFSPAAIQPSALSFANSPSAGLIPEQGNIQNNLFTDQEFQIGGKFAPVAGTTPSSLRYFDVFAIAHWARNVFTELGVLANPQTGVRSAESITKGISFLSSQLLLNFMNPGDIQVGGVANQIYNPLSFALSLVPLMRTSTTLASTNSAAALSITGDVYKSATRAAAELGNDRMLLMRQGFYQKSIDGTDVSKLDGPLTGFLGDIAKQGDPDTLQKPGIPISIEAQVDQQGLLAPLAQFSDVHKNIYTSETQYLDNPVMDLQRLAQISKDFEGTPLARPPGELKLDALFVTSKFPGGAKNAKTQYSWVAKKNFSDGFPSVATARPSDLSVRVDVREDPNTGLVPGNSPIPDDEIYMPFMFQDLRDSPAQLLYFRAFLKGDIAETFTPDWQIERYYGRVDQVPIYMGTIRTTILSFDVVAWSPADLPLMWKKLHKLQSMVYPAYDTRGFLKASPIIRMRVGDLICASGKRGLPGYITSLDFSYDDGIWEIDTDFKIPRKVSVSLSYTILHEGNPGIYPFSTNSISVDGSLENPDNIRTFGAMTTQVFGDGSSMLKVNHGDIRGIIETTEEDII